MTFGGYIVYFARAVPFAETIFPTKVIFIIIIVNNQGQIIPSMRVLIINISRQSIRLGSNQLLIQQTKNELNLLKLP